MNIFEWIRQRWIESSPPLSDFARDHYKRFEEALSTSDVEVMVYDDKIVGSIIVLKGEDLHVVNVHNLICFRKLNRVERRTLDKKFNAKLARKENEKDNKHNLRQADG